ncbi:hypothetical protein DRQ21_11625 [Candidatus Fermentibacteria bacterium]|nr:MAG: hypothetical protein DRQ21_11625 [Candidatus Fermentibacteria bacterium]
MKQQALNRIRTETAGLPERWREVLETALKSTDFSTEAELLLQSALTVHSRYPEDMEPAEAILAGDAFIPMAVESMLDTNCSLEEIDRFLVRATELFDRFETE